MGKTLISVSGRYFTFNGAKTIESCGTDSTKKGVPVALSVLVNTPERIDLWYLRDVGVGETDHLHFSDIADIRTCALNEGTAANAVRLTDKQGGLSVLVTKNPAEAQKTAQRLTELAGPNLEANRAHRERLFARQCEEPSADASASNAAPAAAASNAAISPDAPVQLPTREQLAQDKLKGNGLKILGIIMQGVGYLLLLGMVGAFANDAGNTDWTGAGFGVVALLGLIIGGRALAKKS